MAAYATLTRNTLTRTDARTIAALDACPATLYVLNGGGMLGTDGVLVERDGDLLHAATDGSSSVTRLTGDTGTYRHVTIEYDPTALAAPIFEALDANPRSI